MSIHCTALIKPLYPYPSSYRIQGLHKKGGQNTHPWGESEIPREFQNDWSKHIENLDSAPFSKVWIGDAAGPTVVAIVDV